MIYHCISLINQFDNTQDETNVHFFYMCSNELLKLSLSQGERVLPKENKVSNTLHLKQRELEQFIVAMNCSRSLGTRGFFPVVRTPFSHFARTPKSWRMGHH